MVLKVGVPRPAAAVSPEKLLELQLVRLYPTPADLETLGWGQYPVLAQALWGF